jgi:ribosomal-protein-serine acetyltransferase
MLTDRHRRELRKHMTWVDQTTAVADMTYYILSLDGFWKAGITYGISHRDELVGTVGFHHSDHRNDRTEIGYWLAPPYHGRGWGTRAVQLSVDAAFQYTSVNRIEAKVDPLNRASIRLMEKMGFSYEGLERGGIKFGQAYRDHKVFSILRKDHFA